MASDVLARDMAERALLKAPRQPIQIVVIGQSNERGNVASADQAVYPTAFRSARNPGVVVPIGPAVTRLGGWWPAVYDALHDWGYDLRIANGAMGGLGFQRMLTNYFFARANNTVYNVKRAGSGYGRDRGDFGDIISFGGKIFAISAGGSTRGFIAPQAATFGQTPYDTDAPVWSGGGASASSAPDVSAVAIGGTVTDGALTLTRLDESQYSGSASYSPTQNTYNSVPMPTAAMMSRGFDPLGILQIALAEAQRDKTPVRRIAYIANAQSDLGAGPTTYASVLCSIATFWLQNGFDVMLGLSHFSPASGGTAQYGNLSTGVANALTTLRAYWGNDRVLTGADLYQLMGSTGPMGGAAITASIAGGVLTVTAASSGTIEVGQTVHSAAGVALGIVASTGTGAGGTGTYNLTAAVNTASSSMTTAGAFLQSDRIHINGAGAVGPDVSGVNCAARHVASAIKAALPRLQR